jgi:hypothetical protein
MFTVAVSALVSACFQPKQTGPGIVIPAARADGDGRQIEISPPLALSTDEESAVVRLVGHVTCSGTLIADDLVLTAHHCVTARDGAGRILPRDISPKEITVELGKSDLPWGEVKVKAIVSPDCGYATGEGDIAILVLKRKLIGVATLAVRDTPPKVGEETRLMGFGRCALNPNPIHFVRREGGPIDAVTPGLFSGNASVCPGDSGGPVFSRPAGTDDRGDLVGVVSASVMDGDDTTKALSVFTRIDAWPQLFSAAREIADGATASELPPFRSCEPDAPQKKAKKAR